MGFLHVLIAGLAAFLLWGTANSILFWLAVVTAVGSFWSFGVMHNYATESAKRRADYSGGFQDFDPRDLDTVPAWITFVNLGLAILGLLLLVAALLVRFL